MTSLHITTALLAHPQPSDSFKLRGIGLLCQPAVARGATRLVCPSGGIGASLEALASWKQGFSL